MTAPKVARKKLPRDPAMPESDIDNPFDSAYTAQELAPALAQLYDELGVTGDVETTVHVSLIEADGEANIWKGSPDDYDLENLARQFGSGRYRVKIYTRDTESNNKPCRANRIITWRLSPADERKRIESQNAQAVSSPANQSGETVSVMREMFTAMQLQNERMLTAIANATKEKDPLQTLDGIKQLAAVLVPPHAAEKPRTFADSVQEFSAILALSKSLNPVPLVNNDGEVSANALLLKGIEMVSKTVDAAKAQQTAPAAPVQNPQALPAPATNQFEQTENDDMPMFTMMLKLQLSNGSQLAAKGAESREFAENIYEMLPDNYDFAALEADANWLATLGGIEPRVLQYSEWFAGVRKIILDMAREDGILPALNPDNTGNAELSNTGAAITNP